MIMVMIALLIAAIPLFIWLKTDSAKENIKNFVETILAEELGMSVSLSGVNISLPIIADVENITLNDSDGQVANIANLHINILPSLMSFWEVTIWSISADNIRLFKEPKLKSPKSKAVDKKSYFRPNIIIKDIELASIILDPKFTGYDEDIIFSVDSHVVFKNKKQLLDFVLVSKLLSLKIDDFSNNSLELFGKYDLKNKMLEFKSIKLDSKLFSIAGNFLADVKKDKLSGSIKYQTDYLGKVLAKNIEGANAKLSGNIHFAGSVNVPEIRHKGNLDAHLPKNDYFNYYPLSFETNLRLLPDSIDGTILFKQGDIVADGEIGYKEGKIYLKKMQAKAPEFLKTADLVFDTESNIITGEVGFRDKNLKETSKYFPFLLSGAVDLKFKYFSSDNKAQGLKVDGKLKKLNTKFGSYGYIDIDLNVLDLWSARLDDSKIKLKSFNYDGLTLKEIRLGANSVSDAFFINGEILSSQTYSVDLKFNSNIKQDKVSKNIVVEILELSGLLRSVPFEKDGAINFEISKNNILKIQDLKIGEGKLNLGATLENNKSVVNLNLNKIPFAALPNVFPEVFDETFIDLDMILSGVNSAPKLGVVLDVGQINSDSEKKLSMKIDGKYSNNQLNILSDFLNEGEKLASADMKIPIKFSLDPFVFDINHKQKFNANLIIQDKFDLISLIPLPIGHKISGLLSGGLSVNGTISNPNISGKMHLLDGKYSYKQYGIKLKNIISEISANNSNIIFDKFSAEDNYNNKINVSGRVDLKDKNPFAFRIETEKFNPMNTRYLQGEVKGSLDIEGDNNKAKAKGDFDLGPLEIKIPEHFRQNIPTLNVSEVIEVGNVVIKEVIEEPYDLELDINVKADNQVYVRGWGVDTQLKGDLHIAGMASNPIIMGTLKSIRGRYQEFGKVLNVKEGVLNFDGPISPSPYLSIIGAIDVGGVEIRLVLSGSILNPDISIESSPALSEEAALSKLLFGDDPENISTFQALQLADGMRRLSGHGGGFDPVCLGRKILGVDDISFKSDSEDPEKSSVGVGKHLSDKVYFEVESGRSENSTKTRVEIQLTPKISIENVFEPEGNSSLGINWRFDY